jgi:Fur family transcriptional regulator, ferric uptake regulator
MPLDIDVITHDLAARGLRLTRQRRAVVAAVAATNGAISPLQLFEAARATCPDLGLTTVYRTLEILSEAGALRRVHGADRCEAFVPAQAAHGHVVVCTSCGTATEFTDCDMSRVVEAAAHETGYEISEHFLQLSGLCAACGRSRQAANDASQGAASNRSRTVPSP